MAAMHWFGIGVMIVATAFLLAAPPAAADPCPMFRSCGPTSEPIDAGE
ncbi:MAG: hypothetical protein ACRECX_04205 [Methyloceanibacter sp.]